MHTPLVGNLNSSALLSIVRSILEQSTPVPLFGEKQNCPAVWDCRTALASQSTLRILRSMPHRLRVLQKDLRYTSWSFCQSRPFLTLQKAGTKLNVAAQHRYACDRAEALHGRLCIVCDIGASIAAGIGHLHVLAFAVLHWRCRVHSMHLACPQGCVTHTALQLSPNAIARDSMLLQAREAYTHTKQAAIQGTS